MERELDDSGTNEFNFYTFAIIDGKYANKMAFILLKYPFKINRTNEETIAFGH
jgi:hypothetical protein